MTTEIYAYKDIGSDVHQVYDVYSNEVVCHCLPNENVLSPKFRAENITRSLNAIYNIRNWR